MTMHLAVGIGDDKSDITELGIEHPRTGDNPNTFFYVLLQQMKARKLKWSIVVELMQGIKLTGHLSMRLKEMETPIP